MSEYDGYTTGQEFDTPVVNEGTAGEAEAQANMPDYSQYSSTGNAIANAADTSALSPGSSLADMFSGGFSNPTDARLSAGTQSTPGAASAAPEGDSLSDKIRKAWDFGNSAASSKSPLMQMLLAGVAGAQKNSYEREKAAQLVQNEKDKIAANSASVSGIAPSKGIIQTQLTRVGGAPVFSNGKQIIQR